MAETRNIDKKFRPNKKMLALLQAMLDIDIKPTITAYSEAAHIDRHTYYKWFDNPEFVEWFNKEWKLAMEKQVSWLDKIGLMKSAKDFRYWEAMQMKFGSFSRKEEKQLKEPIKIVIGQKPSND